MKKLFLTAVLAGSLSLACSSTVVANNLDDCADVPKMKLTLGEYHIDLNDKKAVCVPVNTTFTIQVKKQGQYVIQKGWVTVEKKKDSKGPSATVTGNNSADASELKVTIGGTVSEGTTVSFLIKIKDLGELDPKIKIIDNATFLELQARGVRRVMEAYGKTGSDVRKLDLTP